MLQVSHVLKTPSFREFPPVLVYWLVNCILKHLPQYRFVCPQDFCAGVGKKCVTLLLSVLFFQKIHNLPLSRLAWLLMELINLNH